MADQPFATDRLMFNNRLAVLGIDARHLAEIGLLHLRQGGEAEARLLAGEVRSRRVLGPA